MVEKTTTNTTFTSKFTTVQNKPDNVSVSKYRKQGTDTWTNTEEKAYSYNDLGELTSRTDFSNLTNKIKTSYSRDKFGNISTTEVSASSGAKRSESDEYDALGRFIIKHTNNLGQEATFSYTSAISFWGKPSSTTGINGLTTSFQYDAFGRLTKNSVPEGYDIYQSYQWVNDNTKKGVYKTLIDHPYRPNVITYYDVLGREVATETEGYGTAIITTEKEYDNRGNNYLTKQPFSTVTAGYDKYNRLIDIDNTIKADENISYTVNSDGIQAIHHSKNDGVNGLTTKQVDPAGKTILSADYGKNFANIDAKVYYTYDAMGNLKTVKNWEGNVLSTHNYDAYGRQTDQTDISAGLTSYQYDAWGQMVEETNARNQKHTIKYDDNGRVETRTGPEGVTSTEYYPSGSGAATNAIKKITGFAGETTEYFYDSYGRVQSTKETINGVAYTTSFTYTTAGDIDSKTFPSGLTLNYKYDSNGNLQTIKNGNNTITIYSHTSENDLGQVTGYALGNGKSSTIAYENTLPKRYYTSGIQDLNLNWNYLTGNLRERNDALKSKTESFTYDGLDRLTTTKIAEQTITMDYANNGNINSKTNVGAYSYDPTKIYAVNGITNTSNTVPSVAQNITYTAYERPETIAENGYNLTYTYGADYERIKGVMTQNGNAVYTRYFLGDYEKTVSADGTTREIHYISSPAGLIAIVERVNGSDNYHYVYTDHLGSILTVTNSNGNVEAEQSFDAWGRRRNANTWELLAPTAATGLPAWLYRGYTGHEHLDEFGIINMNARLYDPVLGRMISPDNFVNGAFASQAYNRYSYANNNPLKYIDPDGNNPILIGMLIAGWVNIGMQTAALAKGNSFNNFSMASLGQSILMGGLSAGMGLGIGNVIAAQGLTGASHFGLGLMLHGASGAIQASIFGGDPLQGALSGTLGHAMGEALNVLGLSQDLGLFGNFMVGGGSSAILATIMGNDPMQAFIIGGATAAFNSFLHDKPKPKKLPAVPKYDANFHGHGLEPVYIEFDVISGYEAAKGLYFGAKAAIKWGGTKLFSRKIPQTTIKYALGASAKAEFTIKKISDNLIKELGLDPHSIKIDFLGNKSISKFDLYKNIDTDEILIMLKGGKGEPIYTGIYLP